MFPVPERPAPPLVVACDPGGSETGIVARKGPTLLRAALIKRGNGPGQLPDGPYITEVVDTIAEYAGLEERAVVAVEGLSKPVPQLGTVAVMGLVGTGMVLGAVGHGSSFVRAYPVELRPTTGKGRGFDRLRHCRSAFDIAHAALVMR